MSFKYSQYGLGFDISKPNWAALRFEQIAKRRGQQLTVVIKTPVNVDDYGNRVYNESEHQTAGFVEGESKEVLREPGGAQEDELLIFLPIGVLVKPGWVVKIDGERYTVISVEFTSTFNKVKAGRSTQ